MNLVGFRQIESFFGVISELLWWMSKEEIVDHSSAVTDMAEQLSKIRWFLQGISTPKILEYKLGC
jgi:hypothetical protein